MSRVPYFRYRNVQVVLLPCDGMSHMVVLRNGEPVAYSWSPRVLVDKSPMQRAVWFTQLIRTMGA